MIFSFVGTENKTLKGILLSTITNVHFIYEVLSLKIYNTFINTLQFLIQDVHMSVLRNFF